MRGGEVANGRLTWALAMPTEETALVLRVGFLGGDAAAFDVTIDGATVAEVRPKAGATPTMNVTTVREFSLSPAVTRGKRSVAVTFAGRGETGPAKIVFCALVRGGTDSAQSFSKP